MNTPAHLIFGTAAFSSPARKGTYPAALAGALLPDLSLYVMAGWSLFALGIPAETVFREYYYSDAWQAVFAVDNSFILWGALLAFALWRGMRRLMAFGCAGLLHLAFDFPFHTHDARRHFWPVSDWVFVSPVSYWDRAAHAGIVGPMEAMLSVTLAYVLWQRFKSWVVRSLTALFLALQLLSSGIWRFVF